MEISVPLPPEWGNDERMALLFSPFRASRNINPQSWDNKLNFWVGMITNLCQANRCAVINSKTVVQYFERNGRYPACLDVVLNHMKATGQLCAVSQFSANGSWSSWLFNLMVKRPVSWSFDVLVRKPVSGAWSWISGQNAEDDTGEELILVDLVKKIAHDILMQHQSSVQHEATDNVVSYSQLARACRDLCGNQMTFDLAILELTRIGACSVIPGDHGEKLVTFNQSKEVPRPTLTENDKRIYRLKAMENKLKAEITQLEESMASLRDDAKQCIVSGEKSKAKGILVKKKKIEKQRSDKENSLENVQQMLVTIQEAETNKRIIDAFRSGKEAFSDMTQRYGLNPERVDTVMDDIQQIFDEHAEIEASMSQPLSPQADISQQELESELDEILAGYSPQTTPKKVPQQSPEPHQELVNAMCRMRLEVDDLELPDVPSHDPTLPQSFPSKAAPSPITSARSPQAEAYYH